MSMPFFSLIIDTESQNLEFFCFYLKILQQIKDLILGFLTQHLEQPVSVHMQKKWGELGKMTELELFS